MLLLFLWFELEKQIFVVVIHVFQASVEKRRLPRLARLARRNILLSPSPLLSRVARACLGSPAKREKRGGERLFVVNSENLFDRDLCFIDYFIVRKKT